MSDNEPLIHEEQRMAKIHATVWENVHAVLTENASRRTDIDTQQFRTFAIIALVIGCEYRKVANRGIFND